MRRLVVLALLITGCGNDGGAERVLRESVRAIDQHDPEAEARTFVSPEDLAQLVVCDAPDAPWLTAEGRREWIAEALERAREVEHARISVVEPTSRSDWSVWHAGDEIEGRCRARVEIARQHWLLMLDLETPAGLTHPGVGVEVWHWADQWRLWDDPLY